METTMKDKFQHFLKSFLYIISSKPVGFLIAFIQLIITVLFLTLVLKLNILPLRYFLLATCILLLLFLPSFWSQVSKRLHAPFKIISIIISSLLIFVSFKYLAPLTNLIDNLSGANTKTNVASVYVLKDDPAISLSDMSGYTFGYVGGIDKELSKAVLDEIDSKIDIEIQTKEYKDYEEMLIDFFNKKINAIILNEAYMDLVKDPELHDSLNSDMMDNFKNFLALTKSITSVSHSTKVEIEVVDKDITKDAFIMYISGIDVHGHISRTSRSDVNILAVINPKTKQVLLINTPRDSFVYNIASGNMKDKLTHAGIYGIDSSMFALEKLYGVDIDAYFRVNFTGFVDIINALDGVDVYSDYSFTSTHGNFYYAKGYNRLSGEAALSFCRERYAFAGGDRQRGKNQMAVITGVIKKAASSKLLTNYTEILESISGSFETSLTAEDISALVKMKDNDMASWNVKNYSADGYGAMEYTYTSPNSKRSVIVLDMNTVNEGINLINKVIAGEILD